MAEESLAFKHHILNKPFLNSLIQDFASKLKQHFPQLEFKQRPFNFLSTIDIDNAFAYANKEDSSKFLRSHYIFVLRTFYIGAIGFIIAFITMLIFIGPLIHTLVLVWVIVRSVIALQYLIQEIPHPNPLTFWIK